MEDKQSIKERMVLLHFYSGGDSRFVQACLTIDNTLNKWFQDSVFELSQYFPRRKNKAAEIFRKIRTASLQEIEKQLGAADCRFITYLDELYPPSLLTLHTPPYVIYYRGSFEILSSSLSLSVVGSRAPSQQIKKEMEYLLGPLLEKDFVIISGMAAGVDAMAHQTAMKYKGRTAAVLAYGVAQLYPRSNKQLKERLETEQLILTEYPPHIKPEKWRFPERNRIISGLGRAVLVMEAAKRSGSLITAETALEQGKDVFALPGRITDILSEGTNQLIQDGAKLILTAEDIIEEYRDPLIM